MAQQARKALGHTWGIQEKRELVSLLAERRGTLRRGSPPSFPEGTSACRGGDKSVLEKGLFDTEGEGTKGVLPHEGGKLGSTAQKQGYFAKVLRLWGAGGADVITQARSVKIQTSFLKKPFARSGDPLRIGHSKDTRSRSIPFGGGAEVTRRAAEGGERKKRQCARLKEKIGEGGTLRAKKAGVELVLGVRAETR